MILRIQQGVGASLGLFFMVAIVTSFWTATVLLKDLANGTWSLHTRARIEIVLITLILWTLFFTQSA